MDILYRRLNDGDIPKLIELRKKQLAEEGAIASTDIVAPLKAYYDQHIAAETFVGFVAEFGGEIIGTSGLSFASKPPWYENLSGKIGLISSVFVGTSHRRQGIASELVRRTMQTARECGCGVIHINASKDGEALYKSLEFVSKHNFLQFTIR